MEAPKLLTEGLRVLLSWEGNPYYIPPIKLSSQQITICPTYNGESRYVQKVDVQGFVPLGEPYDIYKFVREELNYQSDFDLVIVTISRFNGNMPYNAWQFGCPTVALVIDTHHGEGSIGDLLTYCSLESYTYIVFSYCRQHMHWFYACGFNNVGWLPLITMTALPYPFQHDRERRAVFVGSNFVYHPYRSQVIDALFASSLPVEAKTLDRDRSAQTYAKSLISLNCSLNGDLNLRNLEVVSSGGFLLTDSLSPQAGFTKLLKPQLDCDTYASIDELLTKLSYYLDNPDQAIKMAESAYKKFYNHLHPYYRVNELHEWVFNKNNSGCFLSDYDSRFEISREYADLLEVRLIIYEQIQELHRLQDSVSIIINHDCPVIFAVDLVDLQRATIYIYGSSDDTHKKRINEMGLSHQIIFIEDSDLCNYTEYIWDVCICIEQTKFINAKFSIVLDNKFVLIHSDLSGLRQTGLLGVKTRNQNVKMYPIRYDEASQYVINKVFTGTTIKSYPIFDFIRDVDIVVDIGANIGIAAAWFRANYSEAKIYCFEPDPYALVLLRDNTRLLRNCYVFPIGLYSSDTIKTFYLGQSSIHSSIYKSTLSTKEVKIEFKQADKFLRERGINRIDILKIDTEGCEIEILRSIIPNGFGVKVIYLEFHSEVDRRIIDQLLTPDYILWQASVIAAHRGNLCYIKKELCPSIVGMENLSG